MQKTDFLQSYIPIGLFLTVIRKIITSKIFYFCNFWHAQKKSFLAAKVTHYLFLRYLLLILSRKDYSLLALTFTCYYKTYWLTFYWLLFQKPVTLRKALFPCYIHRFLLISADFYSLNFRERLTKIFQGVASSEEECFRTNTHPDPTLI